MVEHITAARQQASLPNEDLLCAWLDAAEPGERLEYHRGFLARDVDTAKPQRLPEWRRQSLMRLAARARWAAENGVVHLVQIRRGAGDFSYVAIARPKSRKVQSMIAALTLPQAA
ncbi:MAG: hypothetical protein U9R07_11625 [Pseudomonadota bacterium]|jgi:predicted membrane metal-binding protein|nr:hypothetical protein [Pseudomonadota bacterium]